MAEPQVNTAEDAWNGKPEWLDDLADVFYDYYRDTPVILGGHNAASAASHLEHGAVALENEEGGQGGILRELSKHGFVVTEIHPDRFYVRKLRKDFTKNSETEGDN